MLKLPDISRFRAFLAQRGHTAAWPDSQLWLALGLTERLRYPGQARDAHGRFGSGRSDEALTKEVAQKRRIAAKNAAKKEHDARKSSAAEASTHAEAKGTQKAHKEASREHLAAADAALRANRPVQAQAHSQAASQHAGEVSRLKEERRQQQAAKKKDDTPFDVPKRSAVEIMADPKTKIGQTIARAAKENNLDHEMLAHAVQEVHDTAVARVGDREAAKEYARKLTGLTAGDVRSLEDRGFDYSSHPERIGGPTGQKMKGFETKADEVNSQYPGVIGRGQEHEGAEKQSHSAELWDLIKEGKQTMPQPHHPEIIDQAIRLAGQWEEQAGHESSHCHEEFGEF